MNSRTLPIVILALGCGLVQADTEGFEVMGEGQLAAEGQRVSIRVPANKRTVKMIRVKPEGARVEFRDITLYLSNGDKQFYRIRQTVDAGEETREILVSGIKIRIERALIRCEIEESEERIEGTVVQLLGR